MMLGRVTGNVTATIKAERLTGTTLLLFDMVDGEGKTLAGKALGGGLVAVDTVGAGVGDTVLVTQGTAARMAQGLSSGPIDLAIIAVVDRVTT